MPLYALISWYSLYSKGETGEYLLPVSLVGWIWAVINTSRNQELDLGAVTFFLVLITSFYERYTGAFTRKIKWILVVSSIMVAANYGLVFLLWGGLKENFRSTSKSEVWITIFYWYCVVMMAFWVCASIKTYTRSLSENGYSAILQYIDIRLPPRRKRARAEHLRVYQIIRSILQTHGTAMEIGDAVRGKFKIHAQKVNLALNTFHIDTNNS